MSETQDSLRKIVNASGFLFQLRIEEELLTNLQFRKGEWEVSAHEHRWVDTAEGTEGFIDLILQSGIKRMIIECKRVTNANWIFLVPNSKTKTARSRLLWTVRNSDNNYIPDWYNFNVLPESEEAAFCVVRGQGENDRPMLERIASQLLKSVESFASEELSYTSRSANSPIIYFPVIVTNAELHVCHFDPSEVDILTGELSEGNFKQVSYIRFRKTLPSNLLPHEPYSNLAQSNQESERTVFVVNSSELVNFLEEWETPYERNTPWPWAKFSV